MTFQMKESPAGLSAEVWKRNYQITKTPQNNAPHYLLHNRKNIFHAKAFFNFSHFFNMPRAQSILLVNLLLHASMLFQLLELLLVSLHSAQACQMM